jgi:uncharacterized protein YbjT (DUF2867 family)
MSAEFKTVLIAGATGFLGEKIANAFLDKKQFDVRVVVRKANEKTDKLKAKGANVIEADFNDIESLKKATTGVDAVVSVLSKEGLALQPKLIDAAAATGVKRFIPSEFGSGETLAPRGLSPFIDVKYAARDQIEKLGLSHTYIATNVFLEYTFSPFLGVDLKEHKISTYGPDTVFSSIHTDDIARLVPEVLLNPKSKNAVVNLAAETFKWDDVVAELEKLTGKTWTKNALTVEGLNEFLKTSTDFFATFAATLQRELVAKKGAALNPIDNLTDPFYSHIKPISVHDYLVQITKN